MLGRSEERLASAQQEVIKTTNVTADVIPTRICDLGSFQSIRDFVAGFKKGTFLYRIYKTAGLTVTCSIQLVF